MRKFLREIHRRSLWQVLGIYVVASVAVLEAVDLIASNAQLPDWLPAVALVLALIGLPVVLATAFVQEGFGGSDEGADATTQPPSTGSKSLLTWPKAILGGIAAFAIWGIVATVLLVRADGSDGQADDAIPSIAVIPFENMAGDENQYFTDGVHEDIITALTKVGGIKVISRTSVLEFDDPAARPGIPEIAELLGVATILEGSVRRIGDQVRVTAQLIDGENEGHLWAETYDRSVTDVFALQAALAREIAAELGATLVPNAEAELARVPTENAAAYDLFLRARGTVGAGRAATLTKLALVENALELDATFAEAWALYSDLSAHAYQYGHDRTEARLTAALEAAERALELEPDLPEANLALGLYYYRGERDYPRALGHIARASRLRPGWARAALAEGWIARRDGRYELAVEKHRQAVDLDPLNWDMLDDLGQTLTFVRQYEEADDLFRRAREFGAVDLDARYHNAELMLYWRGDVSALREVESGSFSVWYAAILTADSTALGEYLESVSSPWLTDSQATTIPTDLLRALYHHWMGAEAASGEAAQAALDLLEPRIAADPSDERARASAGWAHAFLGRAEDAVREADRAVELAQNDTYRMQWSQQFRLWTHATLGDAEGAAATFEEMVTLPGLGWSVAGLLPIRPLDSVRDDPAFAATVERLRAEGH